jgi:hypothetical protein
MSSATIHVVPANGRWAVQIEGETDCVSLHRIQVVAMMYGRELARARQAGFVVHGCDGSVRRTATFANRREIRVGRLRGEGVA